MKFRALLALALAWAGALPAPALAQPSVRPDVNAILSAMAAQDSLLRNISGEESLMTVTPRTVEGRSYRQEIKQRRAFVYDLEKDRLRLQDLEWDANLLFMFYVHTQQTQVDTSWVKQDHRTLVTFDGRQGHLMHMNNPDVVFVKSRDQISPFSFNMVGIWRAYGLGDRLWSRVIRENQTRFEKTEEIEGSPCYVLKVPEASDIRLWVGPDIGFHIRRIQHLRADTVQNQTDISWQKHPQAQNLWVPVRSTFRSAWMEGAAQYEKIQVNRPLADSLFVIQAAEGGSKRVEVRRAEAGSAIRTRDLPRDPYQGLYGKEPPAWNVTGARGVSRDVKLSDFKGKWVLLEFWGYW